jgi:hypothetical protein
LRRASLLTRTKTGPAVRATATRLRSAVPFIDQPPPHLTHRIGQGIRTHHRPGSPCVLKSGDAVRLDGTTRSVTFRVGPQTTWHRPARPGLPSGRRPLKAPRRSADTPGSSSVPPEADVAMEIPMHSNGASSGPVVGRTSGSTTAPLETRPR